MDFLVEVVLELAVGAGISGKSPKYIRYPLLAIMALVYIMLIGVLFFVGFLAAGEDMVKGIAFLALGLFVLSACIVYIAKLRREYLAKVSEK